MDDKLHTELIKNTEKLRDLTRLLSTESIVSSCATESIFRNFTDEKSPKLTSPYKQRAFLIGLMLTTPELKEPTAIDRAQWEKIKDLLNDIYNSYALMFWPKKDEIDNLPEEWHKVREVAMPAFLNYFNTGLLASVEQVSKRVRLCLTPFDDKLKETIGISASDALKVADYISNYLQYSVDELLKTAKTEKDARHTLLDKARKEGWDLSRLQIEARKEDCLPYFEKMMSGIQGLFKITLTSLKEKVGEDVAVAYWNLFVAKRGVVEEFTYLTERNIAEEKPFVVLDDETAVCSVTNSLYNSLLLVGEQKLINSSVRESFLKKRDKALERQTEKTLRQLFGDSADYYSSVYETPTLQHEHDLIIRHNRLLFVIEAKASPPVEPFRDPDKAFQRIKRAFQSDRGIQKGYDQANRIRQQLLDNKIVELYDNDRNCVATIKLNDIDDIYCICVTRDNFGALAVDLTLLLNKDTGSSYPWVVNIFDLENLLDAWQYFGWEVKRLCEYLDNRVKLHGKTLTADELEIAGFFIQHGSLHYLVDAKADRLVLTPDYSNVFDRIYETKSGGEKVVYKATKPFMGDMREMLREMMMEDQQSQQTEPTYDKNRKIGRNAPCICGSGKKYKRCCGLNK